MNTTNTKEPRPALAGIRIADFSHFVAGPMCSLILADLGAEVIKIEKIDGGDDFRRIGPVVGERESGPFLWANRNKRSIALNLQSPAGQAIARDIVANADILIENFSTGVMARFGLDHETLKVKHPKLIYCSISAYGRTGPLADRLGFDPIAQAESGFMALNGEADGVGVRTGPSVMDISTGIMASNAVLGALFSRERSGEGQYLECALFDTAFAMSGFQPFNYLLTGRESPRTGNNSRDAVPVAVIETSDYPIFLACANDRTWERFVTKVLNRPELAMHPEYATMAARTRNHSTVMETITTIVREKPREYWLTLMREANVPAGAVNSLAQAVDGPEIAARGMISYLPHPTAKEVPNIALPFRLGGTPLVPPVAAPTLGQHTREVLADVLGYDAVQIDALFADNTVR